MSSNNGGQVPQHANGDQEDPRVQAQRQAEYEEQLRAYHEAQHHYAEQQAQYAEQQAQYQAHLAAQQQAEYAAQQQQAEYAAQQQHAAQQAHYAAEQQHAHQLAAQQHAQGQLAQHEAQQQYLAQQAHSQQFGAAPQYANSPQYDGQPLTQVWTPPQQLPARGNGWLVGLTVAGIILAAGALALVLVYMVSFLGPVALIVATIMAMVPLVGIVLAVRWIDRWEPEPRAALWFAFLWGAGVSVAIALIFDFGKQILVYASGIQTNAALDDFIGSTVQAPLVEEFGKGLGILIVFWVFRKSFNGPVDGIVYAAVIAAGFAFTENIQYLGIAMIEGGVESSIQLWIVRCLMSPFAHVLFTVCTGLALGFASRKASAFGAIGWFLLGWLVASMGHAFWNGSMYFIPSESAFYLWYFLTHVPMIIIVVIIVVVLRRSEAKQTRLLLSEYEASGWFTPQEITMLATPAGRVAAKRWAASQGPVKKAAMKNFILDATYLAHARQRIVAGFKVPQAMADERELLAKVAAHRSLLTS